MLGSITKYLLQNRSVCIPHVGTFEIIQEGPHWDVTEKLFTAPSFKVKHSSFEHITDHQTLYLSANDHTEKNETLKALVKFGDQMRNRIEREPFEWNGFGKLSFNSSVIVFEPYSIGISGLKEVPAERVVRENVMHHVLVGDQQMTSEQVTEALHQPAKKRPIAITIAWIVLVLALITIAVILYLNRFAPQGAGLRFGL